VVKREALSLAVPLVLLRVRASRSSEQIATIVFTLRAARQPAGRWPGCRHLFGAF